MTRVIWGKTGERFFEAGVDRGMLYVGAVGVAWPGLVSVEERPIGGTAKAYYYEGDKYANISSREEYEATIAAFTAPPEFAACDGTTQIASGLYVTQQPRVPFDFSYRTRVGNDVDSTDHAYKIHLVYNALAAPASRTNSTLTDDSAAAELSWAISTLPPSLSGHRSTSHLVIDSRATDPVLLADIEDILYGSSFLMPRIPQPEEMAFLFAQPALAGRWLGTPNASTSELVNGRTGEVLGTNLTADPRATASGWGGYASTSGSVEYTLVSGASDGPVVNGERVTTYQRGTYSAASGSGFRCGPMRNDTGQYPAGTRVGVRVFVRSSSADLGSVGPRLWRRIGTLNDTTTSLFAPGVRIPANEWVELPAIFDLTANAAGDVANGLIGGVALGNIPAGCVIDVTCILTEPDIPDGATEVGPYFDGDTIIS